MRSRCSAVAAAAAMMALTGTAMAQDGAATPGARVEVIRLMYADARAVAAALGVLRPAELEAAVAYVPNNQLITRWGLGGVTSGFVTGAFGSPFGNAPFGSGLGRSLGPGQPPAILAPGNGNDAAQDARSQQQR